MASFFKTIKGLKKFINLKNKNEILKTLIELDGIGETQIDSLKFFFSSSINVKIIQDLIDELEIQDYTVKHSDGIFSNKKLMFTGGFKNMSRSEAKSITENNGGKVLGSVSKKLDFLVVGESKPTKKKIDLAKKLNVQILSENEWNKILNR